jgi:hypothetical protein
MAKKPLEIDTLAHEAAKRSGATATLTRNWPGRPSRWAASEFTAVSEIEAEFAKLVRSFLVDRAA